VKFILEEDDEDLTLYKALRLYTRGKIDEDELDGADKDIYRISRASNPAQSEITFEFSDDEKIFELLGLDEDDGWFARRVMDSYSNIDIEAYDSMYDDFIQGYGSLFYNFNEENLKKLQEISQMIIGKKIELSIESDNSLLAKTLDELFRNEASNMIDYFHTYLNEEIRITAKESISTELNEFLNKIGFKLYRNFDMLTSTPANLLMWYLRLNEKDLDFEDLFAKICEFTMSDSRGRERLGGWNENQYEFRDSDNFDDVAFNRGIETQLDRIIEKLEEDEDTLRVSQIYKQIFEMGYDLQRWEELPKDKKYKFRIESVDRDTLKILVKLSQNPYDWHASVILRKVDIEGLKLLLHHPELFKLQENVVKEYFDPIHFLKKKFSEPEASLSHFGGEKSKETFQKVVDYIFKAAIKGFPVDGLNGLKVFSVWPKENNNTIRYSIPDDYNRSVVWFVELKPVTSDWFNWEKNEKFLEEYKNFRTYFEKIASAMGLDRESPVTTSEFGRWENIEEKIFNFVNFTFPTKKPERF